MARKVWGFGAQGSSLTHRYPDVADCVGDLLLILHGNGPKSQRPGTVIHSE